MGFFRNKKGNKSIRATKDESLTKESNMAVAGPTNNKKKGSMRKVSKPIMKEDDSLPTGNSHLANQNNMDIPTDNSSNGEEEGKAHHQTARDSHGGGGHGPWYMNRTTKLFRKPPPAEQAAYSGPPRYDWVDIETHAAVKLQAAWRRRRVMKMMEEEGAPTTSAVRNSQRRRKAAKETETNPGQDFVDLFNCCGADWGIGGGNKETFYDMTREMEAARYAQKQRQKQEREDFLRKTYKKKVVRESLVENVEVVQ